MAIYKRGRVYWYHFVFNNQHIQGSTKQGNPRVARQIEAAHKTRLAPYLVTSLDHIHAKLRDDLQLPKDCVIHSLRHTFLTRFGEAGADAFTIKKVAGHSSVTISERYIHPTPEGQERAFERFANLNQDGG